MLQEISFLLEKAYSTILGSPNNFFVKKGRTLWKRCLAPACPLNKVAIGYLHTFLLFIWDAQPKPETMLMEFKSSWRNGLSLLPLGAMGKCIVYSVDIMAWPRLNEFSFEAFTMCFRYMIGLLRLDLVARGVRHGQIYPWVSITFWSDREHKHTSLHKGCPQISFKFNTHLLGILTVMWRIQVDEEHVGSNARKLAKC